MQTRYGSGEGESPQRFFEGIEDAPVFRPTLAEFEDPMRYICSIRPKAEKSGICKIIPPASWKPAFKLPTSVKFQTRVQPLTGLEATARCRRVFELALRKFLWSKGRPMKALPVVAGRPLDLLALFKAMRRRGGFSAADALSLAEWGEVLLDIWRDIPHSRRADQKPARRDEASAHLRSIYRDFVADFDRHLCRLSPDTRKPVLEALYRERNPERLAYVEHILEDYPDPEELNAQLRAKYNVDLTDQMLLRAAEATARQPPREAAAPAPKKPRLDGHQQFAAVALEETPIEALFLQAPTRDGHDVQPLGLTLVRVAADSAATHDFHPLFIGHVVVLKVHAGGRACGAGVKELDLLQQVDDQDVWEWELDDVKKLVLQRVAQPKMRMVLRRLQWNDEAVRASQLRKLVLAESSRQVPTPKSSVATKAGAPAFTTPADAACGQLAVHDTKVKAEPQAYPSIGSDAVRPALKRKVEECIDAVGEANDDAEFREDQHNESAPQAGSPRRRSARQCNNSVKSPSSRRSSRKRIRTQRARDSWLGEDDDDRLSVEGIPNKAAVLEQAAFPGQRSLLGVKFWKFFPNWCEAYGVVSGLVDPADAEQDTTAQQGKPVDDEGGGGRMSGGGGGGGRMSSGGGGGRMSSGGGRMSGATSPASARASPVSTPGSERQAPQYVVRYPGAVELPRHMQEELIPRHELVRYISCGGSRTEATDAYEHGMCQLCSRAHKQHDMLQCCGCRGQYHIMCIQPRPPSVRGASLHDVDYFCPECMSSCAELDQHLADCLVRGERREQCRSPVSQSSTKNYAFGYEEGRPFTVTQFKEYANKFKAAMLQGRMQHGTDAALEQEYWNMLSNPSHIKRGRDQSEPLSVLYGSDQDSTVIGSGFPTLRQFTQDRNSRATSKTARDSELDAQYLSSAWNLVNLPTSRGSILQHAPGRVTGVTSPWLYFGMLFSSFCWHVEDHNLASISYLHTGAPKSWWGIPGCAYEEFEDITHKLTPQLFDETRDIMLQLVTQYDPRTLASRGLKVCHTVHKPGEFVVTFPRAFHAGFNHGFNCAEACNFANADWFAYGSSSIERYRRFALDPVLPHYEFVFRVAQAALRNPMKEGFEVVSKVRQELRSLVRKELSWRNAMLRSKVTLESSVPQQVHDTLIACENFGNFSSELASKAASPTSPSPSTLASGGSLSSSPVAATPFAPAGTLHDLVVDKGVGSAGIRVRERYVTNMSWQAIADDSMDDSDIIQEVSNGQHVCVAVEVFCDGPAAAAGLVAGDVMVAIDGQSIINRRLSYVIAQFGKTKKTKIRVLRLSPIVQKAAAQAAAAALAAAQCAYQKVGEATREVCSLTIVHSCLQDVLAHVAPALPTNSKQVTIPEENTGCKVCGWGDNEQQILLCDGCDAEYHTYCLQPPLSQIPPGEWFCPQCNVAEVDEKAENYDRICALARAQCSHDVTHTGRERSGEHIVGFLQCSQCNAYCSWSAVMSKGKETLFQCFSCYADECKEVSNMQAKPKELLVLRDMADVQDVLHNLDGLFQCRGL